MGSAEDTLHKPETLKGSPGMISLYAMNASMLGSLIDRDAHDRVKAQGRMRESHVCFSIFSWQGQGFQQQSEHTISSRPVWTSHHPEGAMMTSGEEDSDAQQRQQQEEQQQEEQQSEKKYSQRPS